MELKPTLTSNDSGGFWLLMPRALALEANFVSTCSQLSVRKIEVDTFPRTSSEAADLACVETGFLMPV